MRVGRGATASFAIVFCATCAGRRTARSCRAATRAVCTLNEFDSLAGFATVCLERLNVGE